MTNHSHPPMILDACALIDFINSDRSVLKDIVRYVGSIYVISPIIEEVKEVEDEQELIDLGLIIKEVDLEDAFTAASIIGPISFEDRLCFLTAKRYGYFCVTNDKNLRKCCEKEEIHLYWGLQLLLELHKCSGIKSKDAISIAKLIHKNNPKHISKEILDRFIIKLLKGIIG